MSRERCAFCTFTPQSLKLLAELEPKGKWILDLSAQFLRKLKTASCNRFVIEAQFVAKILVNHNFILKIYISSVIKEKFGRQKVILGASFSFKSNLTRFPIFLAQIGL